MPAPASSTAGNTRGTEPVNRVYFPALDGLRAIAFLSVFCAHYLRVSYGWVGVDCFFALSGFLITGILFDTLDAPRRVRSFYARRTLRIFPLYYSLFLALLITTPFAHWLWSPRWLLWPAYLGNWLVFLHPGLVDPTTAQVINAVLRRPHGNPILLGHLWSLCVEEQFYLFWPFVVFTVRSRRALLWICAAVVLVCPVLRWFVLHTLSANRLNFGAVAHTTFLRIDTLIFGAAAALLYRGPGRQRLIRSARPVAWLAACAALLFFVRPSHIFATPRGWMWMQILGFSVIAVFCTAIVLRTLTPASRFYYVFSWGPLRWVGRISYGAYVFHDIPHLFYLRLAGQNAYAAALLGLTCTLALAALSYRVLEAPFLRLKTRVTAS